MLDTELVGYLDGALGLEQGPENLLAFVIQGLSACASHLLI